MGILSNVKAFGHLSDAFSAATLADSTLRGNDLTPNLRIIDILIQDP